MKFGEICEKLQPSGDIDAFMVKKQLMSSIFGKFFRDESNEFGRIRNIVCYQAFESSKKLKKDQIEDINLARRQTLDLIVSGWFLINPLETLINLIFAHPH